MKKVEWYAMSVEAKQQFIEDAINARRTRMNNAENQKLAAKAREKLNNGERLTVEEFEAFTGVMFSHNMTGKMEGILAISTNVLMNRCCEYRHKCSELVCAKCYADSQQLMYSGVFENTAYNTDKLTSEILPDEVIPKMDEDIVRVEAFGDCNNAIQAVNYIKFALLNPDVIFTIWTKNPGFYAKAFKMLGITKLPKNLHFLLSSDKLNVVSEIKPQYRWFIKKTFTVYTLDWLIANGKGASFINCGGRSCKKCQRCYKRFNKTGTDVKELIKSDHNRAKKLGWNIEEVS